MNKTVFQDREVRIDQIITDGDWPVDHNLMANIRDMGMLVPPILIEDADGKLYLHAGRSRLACAIELGWKAIDVRVAKASPLLVGAMLTLSENIRAGNRLSEARAIRDLEERGMSDDDLLLYSGMSSSTRKKRKSLLRLSDDIQKMIETGDLPVTAGYELAKIDSHVAQTNALKQAEQYSAGRKPSVEKIKYAVATELHKVNPTLPLPPPQLFDANGDAMSPEVFVRGLRKLAATMPEFRAKKLEDAAQEIEKEM